MTQPSVLSVSSAKTFLKKDEEATTLECGHVFHSGCIATYAKVRNLTLAHDEAVQQRASLPAGLLLQAQQAEHTADAA